MSATHKPIIDYFEQLNANLVDFPEDSFFRMDLEEIMGAFRKKINFPAMAVESPEGNAEGSSITSSAIGRVFAFTIYDKSKSGDFADQNAKLDLCERIGLKILARMKYDSSKPGHLLHDKFQVSNVSWIKVGPIFTEMLYGYRFTGIIEGDEPLKVVAADWDDLETVC